MNGLTSLEVNERVSKGLVNEKVDSSTKSIKDIVKENTLTYFNFVFLFLAILLAIVGSFKDMLFLGVIVANTGIGIFQEIRAKEVLDKLSLVNASKTKVIRDDKTVNISSYELVKDDVVIFEAGNQVPADAEVIEGQLNVNEALITGEADEIVKNAGDNLLSGSFVISGKAYARLTKVGKESYISKLTIEATTTKEGEQSKMIRSLNWLLFVLGIAIVPIGIALFVQSFCFNGGTFKDSITSMVAAVIGMIPEGLYLLATVAMAVSTMRLAGKKVLVHDMKCIETLARVDVLCVDKTGTITEPGMQVYDFIPVTGVDETETKKLISDMVLFLPKDNDTMKALEESFSDTTSRKMKKIVEFTSKNKYSAVEFVDGSFVLGAPEFVLRENLILYNKIISQYSKKGFRVLCVAKYDGVLDGGTLTANASALGFIIITNPIRKGAKETFSYFQNHEVEIKVISGDNPETVVAIAKEAGIRNSSFYIDATKLKTKEDFEEAVKKYTIFGRVTPDQKRRLIRALKADKRTVAMTGDGVNDVLALRDADCSIAMASGCDAASNVAQLVLLDSDFSRMPSVVMEGRRVVNNIERSASLYIVKNIFSMLLAIFSVLLMLDYPLEPTQVSLISMFTIGIPSFILALEPNKNPIKGKFLLNVFVKAIPAGITDFAVVSSLVIFCREFNVDSECISTSCTILVAIVGFMILYRIAKPMNRLHIGMMVGLICGLLFCIFNVSDFFAITYISKQCAMLMVIFAIITEPLLRYLSSFVEWGYKKFSLINNIK